MQELTEQQIERANAELAAMADGWILSAEGWRDIAPHLQYAPAPVDGDVIEGMTAAFYFASPGGQRTAMQAAAQVLQSRHDAELAEYKKALGPVTDEEWCLCSGGYPNRRVIDATLANRRALLEKKPEPVDPLHGLTSKYMPETTKAIGLSLHDELIAEAFNRGRSEPKS